MTILEALLGALVSSLVSSAGVAFFGNQRLNSRLSAVELKVAEKYVSKEDLNVSFRKFEEHLIRIETKFDQLIMNTKNDRES